MRIVTAPNQSAHYPDLVAANITDARMKLGMSRISLNHREILGSVFPVLIIDLFSEKGKLYTLRYNLPPDHPERTEHRISLLLSLVKKHLSATDKTTA
ncbi:MAG: hypothetical protein ACRDCA_08775 [Serratia sp. (in: enterobacteria)]|uniref:hypothetical protein n=1 Tax=Serratia sp. (in: enterobacteria) TaxID=616 RepID=UPI003F36E146